MHLSSPGLFTDFSGTWKPALLWSLGYLSLQWNVLSLPRFIGQVIEARWKFIKVLYRPFLIFLIVKAMKCSLRITCCRTPQQRVTSLGDLRTHRKIYVVIPTGFSSFLGLDPERGMKIPGRRKID